MILMGNCREIHAPPPTRKYKQQISNYSDTLCTLSKRFIQNIIWNPSFQLEVKFKCNFMLNLLLSSNIFFFRVASDGQILPNDVQ